MPTPAMTAARVPRMVSVLPLSIRERSAPPVWPEDVLPTEVAPAVDMSDGICPSMNPAGGEGDVSTKHRKVCWIALLPHFVENALS